MTVRTVKTRRGLTVVYALILLSALAGLCSLGADYGRVQLAKYELQRAADAAARAAASTLPSGVVAAQNAAVAYGSLNSADGIAVTINPATDIEFGTWDAEARTFTVLSGTARDGANAVRITARRTDQTGNAVPLIYGSLIGKTSCDVRATAIACVAASTTGYGFVGIDSLTMSGNSDTDSYNSASGPYNRWAAGSRGTIVSNGDISLTGRSEVRGDARAGPGASLTRGRNVTVTGSTANLSSAVAYAPVDAAPYAANNNNGNLSPTYYRNGDFTVNGNQSASIPAGTYYIQDFVISGNANLTIAGQVTLYVTGRFTMSGNTNTLGNRPANFKVRVAGANDVSITGHADLYADLYAPVSDIRVTGNGDLFGSAIGKSLRISGNGSLHVDESLIGESGGTSTAVTTVR